CPRTGGTRGGVRGGERGLEHPLDAHARAPLSGRGPRRPPPPPPPGAGLRRQSRRSNGGYFDPSLRLPRLVLRGDGPSGREVFQQLLDDHAVTPLSREGSSPPPAAAPPKAGWRPPSRR